MNLISKEIRRAEHEYMNIPPPPPPSAPINALVTPLDHPVYHSAYQLVRRCCLLVEEELLLYIYIYIYICTCLHFLSLKWLQY